MAEAVAAAVPSAPDPELTRPDLSCRAVKCILVYLESVLSPERMDALIRSTGMDPAFLHDESNWVSYEYQHRLLKRIVEETGDPEAAFKAGTFAASPQALGALYLVLRPFGTPELVYRALPEFIPRMARTGNFSVPECRDGKATIEFRMKPPFVQNELNCANIQGQLVAVPQAFGLPPAEMEETKCQVRGDDCCQYRVRWRHPPAMHLIGLALGLALGGLLSWTGLAGTTERLAATGLAGLLGYLAGLCYYLAATLTENRVYTRRQTDALTENMQGQEKRYLQLRKAHRSIRQHSLEMTALYRVATVAGKRSRLERAVPEILETLLEAELGIREAMVVLVEEGQEPVAWQRGGALREVEVGSEAVRALREGKTLGQAELGQVSVAGAPLAQAMQSIRTVALPLLSNARPLGLLVLGVERDSPTLGSTGFAQTLAGEVALALDHCFAWAAVENILDSLPVAVMILDEHFGVEYLNPAFRSLFTDPPDVQNLHLNDLVGLPDRLRSALMEEAASAFEGQPGGATEVDCGRRVIASRSFLMRRREPRRLRVGFALTDVTEQKKLLRQLIQSERLAGIGTLASGVAHEINNPLYAIMGLAEAIGDKADASVRRYSDKIVEYSDSIGRIVQELSRYSRAVSAVDQAPVDLAECVEKALALLRHHREHRSAQVETVTEPVARVLGNEQELVQVTLNLVQNAVQATGGRGPVQVSTRMEGGRPTLTVRDRGPGIAEEHVDQLFDAFFTTKPPGQGTGLGLYVVHRIVTSHGGTIRVERPADGGAAFVVELPPTDEEGGKDRVSGLDLPLGPGSA